VNFVVNLVIYGKRVWCSEKIFITWKREITGGGSQKLICSTKKFSGLVGQNPKKSGKLFSAPLIFSFPYAHDVKNWPQGFCAPLPRLWSVKNCEVFLGQFHQGLAARDKILHTGHSVQN
jgi:hypothetical protein